MSGVKRREIVEQPPEDAAEEAGRALGKRRRRVLDELRALGGRATVEELAARLPDVHLATVYRALHVLEELGVVGHVHLAHGPAVYELSTLTGTTRHLVCEECGAHIVVEASVFDEFAAQLADRHGFVLDAQHFALVGRCRACAG